ncbi:PREDICTED: putative nuclease HARBI1 [Camelina sativa]|uniref:Nuclease HARBI1 n=1 Tax=Camelina sativa TaxID=90675 RepID=A0ABM0Y489_CAMSA|nr:PREDICTED: putative nuclease HARBI1 [Camelina sativa]
MAKPEITVPTKIRESTRFYPYFKDCVGAIDGTHILAMVPTKKAPSYRNRKGDISQNVLAACNFDLEFMYVLSGWEGSAHDSKVLNDALTRNTNRLPVPEEIESAEEVVEEINDDDNAEVLTTQEQQREYANEWRETIASNMWTDSLENAT